MQNEQLKKRKSAARVPAQILFDIFLVVAALLFVVTAIVQKATLQTVDSGAYAGETVFAFDEGWTDASGNPVEPDSLSAIKTRDENGRISLSNRFPDAVSDEWDLMFVCSNTTLDIYVDGEAVFGLHPEHIAVSGKSFGTRFCNISLRSDWAGKTVTVVADPIYSDSGSLRDISIGDRGTYLNTFYLRYFPALIMSLVVMFVGILFLIFSIAIVQAHPLKVSLRAFAVASILFGIWAAVQSMIPTMLLGNTDILRMVEYPILLVLPYTIILATNGLLNHPKERYIIIGFCGLVVEVFVCFLLALIFGFDLHESRVVNYVAMLAAIGFIIWMVSHDERANQASNRPRHFNYVLPLGLSIIFIAVIIDVLRHNLSQHYANDSAFFTRIGFFVFQLLVFYRYVITVIAQMRTATETELYRKMAYKDALTGICNRASFLELEDELKQRLSAEPELQVACCSLDINFLKVMNDTYGHAMGDRYIQCCAEIIRSAFKGKGKYYRVGGDEFITFLWGDHAEEEVKRCLSVLTRAVEEENRKESFPFPISIAWGYAVCFGGEPMALETAEVLADRRMYEMKKQMKSIRED